VAGIRGTCSSVSKGDTWEMLRYYSLHAKRRLSVHHSESPRERREQEVAQTSDNQAVDDQGNGETNMLALPRGVSLTERKALSFRSKMFMIVILTLMLTIANIYVVLYLSMVPLSPCRFSLHSPSTGCRDIDPIAVFALLGGIVGVGIFVHEIYVFASTPMYLRSGEELKSCYLENATAFNQKLHVAIVKGCGVLAILLEVLIAAYNLSPWLYLLVFFPTFTLTFSIAQKYLKV